MNVPKFIHSVQDVFRSEIERENAELQRIEKAQQDRLVRQGIISRAATFKDQLTTAHRNADTSFAAIERLANWPLKDLFGAFAMGGLTVEQLGGRLAEVEATAKHLAEIKKAIYEHHVKPAELALVQFEKENAAVLKGVKLEQSEPPAFIPTKLDRDHYVNGASSELVRKHVGITN